MNIEWIYSFIVLAKTGNFSSASNELFITQQTLSYQINKLEEFLDTKLIERGKKDNKLTSDGEILFSKTKYLLNSFESEVEKIKNKSQKQTLNVIQSTDWNFDYSISMAIIDFYKKNPKTNIKLFSLFFDEIEKSILENKINIALSTKAITSKKVTNTLIGKIPYIIVSKNDCNDELNKLKFLSPNYHSFRKIKTKQKTEDIYKLDISIDVASLTPAIELCKRGLGAMYVPVLSVENELRENSLVIIDYPIEKEYQDLFIITRKDIELSEIENNFIEDISKNINKSMKWLYSKI